MKTKQNKNRKPLDHISVYNSVLKHSENVPLHNKFWWVMKNRYCKMMWNGRDYGLTTTKAGLHPKNMVHIWWDWKRLLYHGLLLGNQMINPIKYFPKLGQIKAALDENHLELVNRKCIIFHQDNEDPLLLWWPTKSVTAWLGSSESSAVFTRHYTFGFSIYFGLYKILLMEEISIPWKTVKDTCKRHLLKKISLGKMELWSCLKNGRR